VSNLDNTDCKQRPSDNAEREPLQGDVRCVFRKSTVQYVGCY